MSAPVTRTCATCGTRFHPVARSRYCSDACRCGTDAGYNAGCGCDRCKEAHARNHKRLRCFPNPTVDAVGTHRRIQALARLGWSPAAVSRHLGRDRSYLQKVLQNSYLEVATVLLVRRVYDELSMTWCTAPTAGRTAAEALARGWAAPLDWDDESIDDPDASPVGSTVRPLDTAEVDEVAVERVLSGDWATPTTPADRREIVARWQATGRPLAELARLTGWKVERYYTPGTRQEVA